ncbi:MAG: IPT/TIG domain-containing protein, partial [Bacteroidota bacterium]
MENATNNISWYFNMKLQFSGIFNLFLLLCFAASSPCRAQSPAIFNISPDVGRAGEKVVITGNNFGLVSNVRFGNKEAIFTIYNNSTIVAIAP